MVLDIQPQPLNSKVEVRRRDHTITMGYLDEAKFVSEVLDTREILDDAIDEGLFAYEGNTSFEFSYYFDTVDEWTTYMREHDFGDARADRALIARTSSLLSQVRGEIVIREPAGASMLRRLD